MRFSGTVPKSTFAARTLTLTDMLGVCIRRLLMVERCARAASGGTAAVPSSDRCCGPTFQILLFDIACAHPSPMHPERRRRHIVRHGGLRSCLLLQRRLQRHSLMISAPAAHVSPGVLGCSMRHMSNLTLIAVLLGMLGVHPTTPSAAPTPPPPRTHPAHCGAHTPVGGATAAAAVPDTAHTEARVHVPCTPTATGQLGLWLHAHPVSLSPAVLTPHDPPRVAGSSTTAAAWRGT